MSVYYVNAGDTEETVDENGISTPSALTQTQSEAHQSLAAFWPKVNEEIKKMKIMDLKVQALPLARIKKIMKLDEDVKMISAEAPMLFAKAAEMFIHELTLRAWIHTQDNKRRTLQRNDIAMAITKYDQFDFLIDIVPREEIKPANATKTESKGITTTGINSDQVHYYFQIAQQHQQALQNASADTASTSQTENAPSAAAAAAATTTTTTVAETVQTSNAAQVIQTPPAAGGLQIVHQIVTPSGEVQNIPLQLTPQQLQMIRMQLQGNSNQPLILQTGPVHVSVNNPIQVAPQGTQVFITPTSQSEGE